MSLARDLYGLTAAFQRSEVLASRARCVAPSCRSPAASLKVTEGTDKGFALFLSQAPGSLNELGPSPICPLN
jgi:hypothetical protein